MRIILALLIALPYTLAQFCGPDEIPDKIAINRDGEVAIGCRYNECPRNINDPGVKSSSAPKCGKRYYELSCGGPLQWVGGIPRGSNLNNVVPLQCCTAQQLKDAPTGKSNKIVEPGQVFEGTVQYDRLGNVKSYDIIKNVQKVRLGEGRYALSVTVGQLMCDPKRAAQFDNAQIEQQFGDVREAEVDGTFQGPFNQEQGFQGQGFDQGGAQEFEVVELQGGAPQGQQFGVPDTGFGPEQGFGAQQGFAGPQQAFIAEPIQPLAPPALPPPAAPFLPPPAAPLGALGGLGAAAAGGGVCFSGDTMVETPSGPKRMDELKIGDQVLAVINEQLVSFSPVTSFLHRVPDKTTKFQKISTKDSSVTLTPYHYIYTTSCGKMRPKMKFAKDVVPNMECLIRVNGEKLEAKRVESNDIVELTGIYNPITDAKTIVADGFMASVHNVLDDTNFMNTFVEVVQEIQRFFTGEHSDNLVELPWALRYVMDYTSKLF